MNVLKTILLSLGLIILDQIVDLIFCGLLTYVLCLCFNVDFEIIYAIGVYLIVRLLKFLKA